MQPPAGLIFDLDGTLVDSRRDLSVAINRVRTDYGWSTLSIEQVTEAVGEGARVLVASALGFHRPDETMPESLDEALERFYRHYDDTCLETTKPYPGVEQMLADLAERYPLTLYTNKPERFVRKILEGVELIGYFPAVLGGDSLPTRKPEPPGVRHLAEAMGVPVAATMLVGDSRIDAHTARAAGCRFAFAEWGFAEYDERQEIRDRFRPEIKAANPGQLARRLLDLEGE
ncbi:MAG TPA: HAD-IA family hydrolase [Thermoanaerobaculia bacterium]